MKSFDAIQNVIQTVSSFSIGPTAAQAQGAPNAQAEQVQNQLPIISTEPGHFKKLPFELFTEIFKNLTLMENLYLRLVSKTFYKGWEQQAAKNLLFSSKPTIRQLGLKQVYEPLHTEQQKEIKFLIENKEGILKVIKAQVEEDQNAYRLNLFNNPINNPKRYFSDSSEPRLRMALEKLSLLEENLKDSDSLAAYHAKEKCINTINKTICKDLYEKQRKEIKFLIENKEKILETNNNDSQVIMVFNQLPLLENRDSLKAYLEKENCLNTINTTMIKRQLGHR